MVMHSVWSFNLFLNIIGSCKPIVVKIRAMAKGCPYDANFFLIMDRLYDNLERRIQKVWLPKDKRQKRFWARSSWIAKERREMHSSRNVLCMPMTWRLPLTIFTDARFSTDSNRSCNKRRKTSNRFITIFLLKFQSTTTTVRTWNFTVQHTTNIGTSIYRHSVQYCSNDAIRD